MSARVAVVDDDRLLRTILAEALHEAGFSVSTYGSAEEALVALWDAPVDALVTDLYLPRMSGFDLMRELKSLAWARHTPCVAISAVDWPAEAVKPPGVGGATPQLMWRKPFSVPDLVGALNRLVDEARPRPSDAGAPSQASAAGPERRRSERTDARLKVELRSAHEVVVEYSENLSYDGLFVQSLDPLPVDTQVEVDLHLPYREMPMPVQGTVVRCIRPDSPEARLSASGMGIALTTISDASRNELRAFLAGFREGLVHRAAGAEARRILLVGMRRQLAPDGRAFLRRTAFKTHWVGSLEHAREAMAQVRPNVVVVAASQLSGAGSGGLDALGRTPDVGLVVVGEGPPLGDPAILRLTGTAGGREVAAAIAECLHVRRRAHPRAPVRTAATLRCVDGLRPAGLEDVSLGGVGFIVDKPCAVGERLELEFELPGVSQPVRAKACVRWVCAHGHQFRVGASFLQLSPESCELLREFVQARSAAVS